MSGADERALDGLDAVALARAIRDRHVSALEVVEHSLAQIATLDGAVNAFTVTLGERARRQALAADRDLRTSRAVGPLHGVPVAIRITSG
jgi:amidase